MSVILWNPTTRLLVCIFLIMTLGGYQIRDQSAVHFLSFAVVDWIDVFTRREYQNVIIEALNYHMENHGVVLNAWCLMHNHLHLVASSSTGGLSGFLRSFKSYTAKELIKRINENKRESKREWMMEAFRRHGKDNSRNTEYQFWRQDNQPKVCYTTGFIMQKINYLHNNPVVAGLVDRPEDYRLSSAKDYFLGRQSGLLKVNIRLHNLDGSDSSS